MEFCVLCYEKIFLYLKNIDALFLACKNHKKQQRFICERGYLANEQKQTS